MHHNSENDISCYRRSRNLLLNWRKPWENWFSGASFGLSSSSGCHCSVSQRIIRNWYHKSRGINQCSYPSQKKFVLRIFTPQGSKFQYLGIWYKNTTNTVVWVANRDNPLVNSTGRLTVIKEGSIVLLNGTGEALWSTSPSDFVKESVAQLLDTCNLVLLDSGSGNYV